MHLISLSLLLLASWPALAAPSGDVRARPWHQDKRDLSLLNHPYPLGYRAASCSRASTNIFKDHGLVPQQTIPEPFRGNFHLTNGALRIVSARANQRVCRQIGSLRFVPVAERLFSIQKIQLDPAGLYVLSVEATSMVKYLSAFILALAPPHRQRVVDTEPFQNVGELRVSVDEPSEVFFLVVFQSPYTRGEVALFSIAGPEIGEG